MRINNREPLIRENGLLALIVGKPIEMVIGGMLTIIMGLLIAIYHDGHDAILKVADQMDKIEARVTAMEKTDATQNSDIANVRWVAQFGLVPKPPHEETLPDKK